MCRNCLFLFYFKIGLDVKSEACQRFFRDGLTISFTKILTDEAVSGWKFEIHVSRFFCLFVCFEKQVILKQERRLHLWRWGDSRDWMSFSKTSTTEKWESSYICGFWRENNLSSYYCLCCFWKEIKQGMMLAETELCMFSRATPFQWAVFGWMSRYLLIFVSMLGWEGLLFLVKAFSCLLNSGYLWQLF